MMSTVEAQFIFLIVSVFAGLIMGMLFDLYRTLNYFTRPARGVQNFLDLLFWLITAAVVFSILLRADFANLRIYTFLGMAVGLFIYFKLFSEYILIFYRGIIQGAVKLVRLIIIFIALPFKMLHNILWGPFNFMKKALLKGGNRAVFFVKANMKKIIHKK